MLTEQQWNDFAVDGFLHLGAVLTPAQSALLRERADELALGCVDNAQVQMQLDTGGAYEDLPAAVESFDGGTTRYRKIQGLETDDRFAVLLRHPLFRQVCARAYGPHASISIFRAMVMNKPAGQGTMLPWHQDGGDVWGLDRDPLVTIWVALDSATVANGCLEVVPGSHRLGLLSSFGSTVSADDVARYCPIDAVAALEVEAGHAVVLHNWLLHRSGVNPSAQPRRAFTTCFMDGRTRSTLTGDRFPIVWGELPDDSRALVGQLHDECVALRESQALAEQYALSLQETNRVLQASIQEATIYARSLEAELARVRGNGGGSGDAG